MLSRRRYLEAEGLTLEGVSEKLRLFGENSVDVKPPTFWHHLGERLTNPFVVFSLFNQARLAYRSGNFLRSVADKNGSWLRLKAEWDLFHQSSYGARCVPCF